MMLKIKSILALGFSALLIMVLPLGATPAQAQTQQPELGCPVDDGPPPSTDVETLVPEAGKSEPYRQQAYIKASNTDGVDFFGDAVAVSGDTLVVGAPQEDSKARTVNGVQNDNSLSNAGAVYVYVLQGGVWKQQAYLKASAPDADDRFGTAVAISGNRIVVGAPEEDSNATGVNGNHYNDTAQDAGAVYVFNRTNGVWMLEAYIKASNTQAGDRFGTSVSISDDTVVVGAPGEDSNAAGVNGNQSDNSALDAGAVYVFGRGSGALPWHQQAYIKASNTDSKDAFGTATAISGNTLVIGAPIEQSNATGVNGNQSDNSLNAAGAAYAFIRNGNLWSQQAYIKGSDITHTDVLFGSSVAVSGSTIVVGAPLYPDIELQYGSAYVFTRNGGIWSQQAQLGSTAGDCYDGFGASVGISGDTLIIGAPGDDNPKTGVNGQSLYPGERSGAAYTFVRDNNVWTQRAFIKASTNDAGDEFGGSVAISGNILAAGAHEEYSSAKGINGDQSDNSMPGAGAAYVFSRIPTVYASQLTSANPTTANTVDFDVTFSDASTGVDVSDFKVVTSSQLQGVSILGVSGGPVVYMVTVNTGSGNGTIRLDVLDDDSIRNSKNVPLGGVGAGNGNFSDGESYIVRLQTKVFRAQSTQDGWLLESGENTNVGGTIDNSGSLIVGDAADNKSYRSIVSFDTSGLPDTAVIFSGIFKLRKELVVGTDPFTTHGPFDVTLCKGFFGATSVLELDDFNFYRLAYCSSAHPEYHVNGGVWYDIVQGSVERPRINVMGLTQYRLAFALDDDNDETTDYVSFYSGDATTASYRPALVVEYYVK